MGEQTAEGAVFGARLREYRAAANLTQEQLAARAGLSVPAVSMLERGARKAPRPSTVELLAEALGLDPSRRAALVAAARGQTVMAVRTSSRIGPDPHALLLPPPDVADFTGRTDQVSLLFDQLDASLQEEGLRTVVVSAVAGRAGVGKTTLAVHVAHRLSHAFPDGLLYVDLHGASARPTAPGEVLA